MGNNKNIVILTRPEGYKKKKGKFLSFSKWVYRKFPQFAKAIENRADMYNKQLEFVEAEALKNKNTLIIRPSIDLKVKHMEKNLNKVKAMYELGRHDALKMLNEIKYLWHNNEN
jgi:predicted patatin/cPLA2 family phospholipase